MAVPIILASRSRRRKKLLKKIIRRFCCLAPPEPRIRRGQMKTARAITLFLAKAKATWAAAKIGGAKASGGPHIIIAADTLLSVGKRILGQPKNKKQAKEMLKQISGQTIRACTSICAVRGRRIRCWSETASVKFKKIEAGVLKHYLASGAWRGKAGGFNIEEKPIQRWIKAVKGDKNVVIGLPLKRLKNN